MSSAPAQKKRKMPVLFQKDILLSPDVSLRAALAEYMATFFFITFSLGTAVGLSFLTQAAGSGNKDLSGARQASAAAVTIGTAFAFGFSVIAMLYASSHSSGGQMNPAVVLGFLVAGRMPIAQACINVIAEILGSITGAAVILGIIRARNDADGRLGGNSVPLKIDAGGAFLGEMVGTFALVFVVLETVANHRSLAGSSAPLAIGITVFAAHLFLIPFTSCGINPARSLGPAIVSTKFGREFWVFIIGPIVGAILGALAHRYFDSELDTVHAKHALKVIPGSKDKDAAPEAAAHETALPMEGGTKGLDPDEDPQLRGGRVSPRTGFNALADDSVRPSNASMV